MMPHNPQAENAVLGAILENPNSILRVMVELKPSHFYSKENEMVYEAMVSLCGKHTPIDRVMLVSELESKERLDKIGGVEYLDSLKANGENIQYYANLVREASIKRTLVSIGTEISSLAMNSSIDADKAIAESRAKLIGIGSSRTDGTESISEIGYRVMEKTERMFSEPDKVWALPTGIRELDRALGGLEKQDNIVIAGRPGSGKSALADTIAVNVAKTGKRVVLFALEMSKEQRTQRMACMHGGFIYDEVRRRRRQNEDGKWRYWTDEEVSDYMYAISTVNTYQIYINDVSAIKVSEIEAVVGNLSLEYPVDLVIVDYLGLVGDAQGAKRYDQVGQISRGLKGIAKSMDVPLLNLAQLNRDCEKRPDKKPELADLRDAGDIEQDADVVILIWRAGMYWEDELAWNRTFPKDPYPGTNVAELNIAKFRNGNTGFVNIYFDAPRMRYLDLERRV